MAHTNRTIQSISITYLLSSSKIWAVLLHNLQQLCLLKHIKFLHFLWKVVLLGWRKCFWVILGYSGLSWFWQVQCTFLINAVIHLCSFTIIGFVERARLRIYTWSHAVKKDTYRLWANLFCLEQWLGLNKDLKRLAVETTANQVIATLNGNSWFFWCA